MQGEGLDDLRLGPAEVPPCLRRRYEIRPDIRNLLNPDLADNIKNNTLINEGIIAALLARERVAEREAGIRR